MSTDCIVAAHPKGTLNHVNSQFLMYLYSPKTEMWTDIGWQSIDDVSQIMRSGDTVVTGQVQDGALVTGATVELELRIARNGTRFKISDMADT